MRADRCAACGLFVGVVAGCVGDAAVLHYVQVEALLGRDAAALLRAQQFRALAPLKHDALVRGGSDGGAALAGPAIAVILVAA